MFLGLIALLFIGASFEALLDGDIPKGIYSLCAAGLQISVIYMK